MDILVMNSYPYVDLSNMFLGSHMIYDYGELIKPIQFNDGLFLPGVKFRIATEGETASWVNRKAMEAPTFLNDIIKTLSSGGVLGYIRGYFRLITKDEWRRI
jgi:hypothetical protein